MKTNTIITIGRQFGSAGREIGYQIADYFGIKLYDKEMLSRAAKESGICEEIFETHDEKPTNSFLYSLVMDTYSMGYSGGSYSDMPINHKVFLAQFDAIKKIADEGPCILVGRCADYALESYDNVVNVFIHADLDAHQLPDANHHAEHRMAGACRRIHHRRSVRLAVGFRSACVARQKPAAAHADVRRNHVGRDYCDCRRMQYEQSTSHKPPSWHVLLVGRKEKNRFGESQTHTYPQMWISVWISEG
jgi:hypothetical protein